MNKYYFLFFSLGLLNPISAQKDTNDFKKEFNAFSKLQTNEYTQFRDKINAEFAVFLKQNWKQFNVEKPIEKPLQPKPKDPIRFIPSKQDTTTPLVPEEQTPKKEPEDTVVPKKQVPVRIPKGMDSHTFLFFNTEIPIRKSNCLSIQCEGYSENAVSAYWTDVTQSDYTDLITELQQCKVTYQLNDWALYLLIKKIAEELHTDINTQTALQFFCLTQLGYDTKIGRVEEQLVLLINFQQMVYNVSYLTIQDKKYFITTDINNRSIYSFQNEFKGANTTINLEIHVTPKINYTLKSRNLNFQNTKLSIRYPMEMVDFYTNMPSTDFSVLFNSSINPLTENALIQSLSPFIQGKTEQEAVCLLLTFVQESFEYQTDQAQFGSEKYFFVEDILNYPYSDCEDRSVFFAYLVRRLLHLEVIGLSYPNHIATAVRFSGTEVGATIRYHNKTYTMCDPTYIGAPAGECMPEFVGVQPKVIEIR